MRLPRFHTSNEHDPLKKAGWRRMAAEDGQEYIVPKSWSDAAAEVLIEKVFCKIPLPSALVAAEEDGVPRWLWRQTPAGTAHGVPETDFRAAFTRIAGGFAYHGWKAGLFPAEEDARNFFDEFRYLLLHQIAAPELSLLAAAGLDWAYGLGSRFTPDARILNFADALSGQVIGSAGVVVAPDIAQKNILKRVTHLAAGQSIDDAIRKTAVTLPVENIDSAAFVALKRQADLDAVAGSMGRRTLAVVLNRIIDSCDREAVFGFDPAYNGALKHAIAEASAAGVSDAAVRMALSYAQQGYEGFSGLGGDDEAEGPAIDATLSLPDDFIEKALTGHGFLLQEANAPKKHVSAESLWDMIAAAIWSSGDPALFFRDSAMASSPLQGSARNLSPGGKGGFIFLPDTAAPGATVNIAAFTGGAHILDAGGLGHAVKTMTIALEASFAFIDAPPATRDYLPLNIGILGLSSVLLSSALAYDSEEGRAVAGLLSALVSAAALEASAEIASRRGAFLAYGAVEKNYLQGLKDKMSALSGTYYMQKGVTRRPVQLKAALSPDPHLAAAVRESLARAYALGRDKGFRHAHLTGLGAEPGMQALLQAPARDIAPLPALVRFEGHFAGSGEGLSLYGKKLNPLVPRALSKLGYGAAEIDDINFYAVGHGTLLSAPGINHAVLKQRGFHQAALDALEAALGTAQHIRYVFNKWTLGEEFCRHVLGFAEVELAQGTFDMLRALGFSEDDIDDANLYCCGALTLEGAPHLLPQHLAVFDGLAPGGYGLRRVSPEAQVKMQGAVEPFLSGAASHTIELSHYATIEEVQRLCLLGWELGVKRLRLYREGCSLLHPLALPLAEVAETREEDLFEPHRMKSAKAS